MNEDMNEMSPDALCIGNVSTFYVWCNNQASYSITDGVLGDVLAHATTEEEAMALARQFAPEPRG